MKPDRFINHCTDCRLFLQAAANWAPHGRSSEAGHTGKRNLHRNTSKPRATPDLLTTSLT